MRKRIGEERDLLTVAVEVERDLLTVAVEVERDLLAVGEEEYRRGKRPTCSR